VEDDLSAGDDDDSSSSSSSSSDESSSSDFTLTSAELIRHLDYQFELDQHSFVTDIKLVQDTEQMLELITSELASVSGTSDDPVIQLEAIKSILTN
jgi:hypothetical protein